MPQVNWYTRGAVAPAVNTGEGGTITENPFAKEPLNVEMKNARAVTECSNLMAWFGYQDGKDGFVVS